MLMIIFISTILRDYIRNFIYSYSFNRQNISSTEFFNDIKHSLFSGNGKIPKKSGIFRVVIVNRKDFTGEAQTAFRLSKVFDKFGWEWCSSNLSLIKGTKETGAILISGKSGKTQPLQKFNSPMLFKNSHFNFFSQPILIVFPKEMNIWTRVNRYDGTIVIFLPKFFNFT